MKKSKFFIIQFHKRSSYVLAATFCELSISTNLAYVPISLFHNRLGYSAIFERVLKNILLEIIVKLRGTEARISMGMIIIVKLSLIFLNERRVIYLIGVFLFYFRDICLLLAQLMIDLLVLYIVR